MSTPQLLRALAHRNFRLFFYGQGLSLIGTWITRVATSWLVYRLTGSALLLGVVNFAGQIPNFLLSPVAGVLADRWNLRRVLVITQILSMLQSFALAALALTHVITVPQLIALSILQGVVNAFDTPARQAFAVEMVDGSQDLPNAIAINSMMFNAARLVGPMVAGLIIAASNEGVCYLVDGVSYLARQGTIDPARVCIVGASELEIDTNRGAVMVRGRALKEGDDMSLDGFTGERYFAGLGVELAKRWHRATRCQLCVLASRK
jgi:MFS family permease